MAKISSKKSLLFIGGITLAAGFLLNMAFVTLHIGGIVRELSRLTVLVGLILVIAGVIKKLFLKSK